MYCLPYIQGLRVRLGYSPKGGMIRVKVSARKTKLAGSTIYQKQRHNCDLKTSQNMSHSGEDQSLCTPLIFTIFILQHTIYLPYSNTCCKKNAIKITGFIRLPGQRSLCRSVLSDATSWSAEQRTVWWSETSLWPDRIPCLHCLLGDHTGPGHWCAKLHLSL